MTATRSLLALLPFVLVACDGPRVTDALNPKNEDSKEVRARYRGRYTGPCNAWAWSPFTGKEFCASPWVEYSNLGAYAAVVAPASEARGVDPFEGFDGKSAEEKRALLMAQGESLYGTHCGACHQPTGQGLPNAFPPLAGDPVANGGPVEEHVGIVLNGLNGKVINGVSYAAAMTPFAHLSDAQIAAIVTYERNSWGNAGGVVEPAQVAPLRKK